MQTEQEYYKDNNNNKMSFKTFSNRVKSGMSFDVAINKDNKVKLLEEYYEKYTGEKGINLKGFIGRVQQGWTYERAISTKSRFCPIRKHYEENVWNRKIKLSTFRSRVKKGMSYEEAFLFTTPACPIRKYYDENIWDWKLKFSTFRDRVKKGASYEEALKRELISYPLKEYYDKNIWDWKLKFSTFKARVKKGMSYEEALSQEVTVWDLKEYYDKNKNKDSESLANFYSKYASWKYTLEESLLSEKKPLKSYYEENFKEGDVTFRTFCDKVKKGFPKEEAIGREKTSFANLTKEYYDKNVKDKNISLATFRGRVNKGMSFKEALNKEIPGALLLYYKEHATEISVGIEAFIKRVKFEGFTREEALMRTFNIWKYYELYKKPGDVGIAQFRINHLELGYSLEASFERKKVQLTTGPGGAWKKGPRWRQRMLEGPQTTELNPQTLSSYYVINSKPGDVTKRIFLDRMKTGNYTKEEALIKTQIKKDVIPRKNFKWLRRKIRGIFNWLISWL